MRSSTSCSVLLGCQVLMLQAKGICHRSRGNAHRHSSKCTRRRTCELMHIQAYSSSCMHVLRQLLPISSSPDRHCISSMQGSIEVDPRICKLHPMAAGADCTRFLWYANSLHITPVSNHERPGHGAHQH